MYNDLAGNIKHQTSIYSLIFPFLEAFEEIAKANNKVLTQSLLGVLDYIFIDFYRASTSILSEPAIYSLAMPDVLEEETIDLNAFQKFKDIYLNNPNINKESSEHEIYYRTIFSDSTNHLERYLKEAKKEEKCFSFCVIPHRH